MTSTELPIGSTAPVADLLTTDVALVFGFLKATKKFGATTEQGFSLKRVTKGKNRLLGMANLKKGQHTVKHLARGLRQVLAVQAVHHRGSCVDQRGREKARPWAVAVPSARIEANWSSHVKKSGFAFFKAIESLDVSRLFDTIHLSWR